MSRPLATLLVVAATGCYSTNLSPRDSSEFESDDTADADTAVADTDTAPTLEPDHFSLDGTVVITDAAAITAASTFEIGFYAESTPVCSVTLTPTAIDPATPTDDAVTLFGWWNLTLPATTDATCPWPLPSAVAVGIGTLDSRLLPAVDASGLSESSTSLYGLYTQYDAGPLYVYGVAGTSANFDGTATPASAAPLPDGTYELRTLHLLPLAATR